MSNRKSTTARTVYRSPEGRVIVERTEDADYILSVDDCCAGVYTNAHAAEVAGLVELEYRVRQERVAATDEAAAQAAASAMDAALDLTCSCQLCGEPVLPDQAHLVGEQMACPHCEAEAAYYAGRMAAARATASPAEALAAIADLDYEDRLRADAEDAELAARNFTSEADEAAEAYQQAYRAGWEVMQDARAEAPSLRLLWSWAGNAKALRALMDERHAAWFARAAATVAAAARGHRHAAWLARQERMRVTAGKLGLLSREAK